MTSNIKQIREAAETAIAALVPDLESNITFRRAPLDTPLANQSPLHSPSETTRTFQVTATNQLFINNEAVGNQNPFWGQEIRIAIRYHIPPRDGGWVRLYDLLSADQVQIMDTLIKASTWIGVDDACMRYVDIDEGGDEPIPVLEHPNVWIATLRPRVHYTRGLL
jgi:hypothetical protein